MNEIEAVAVAIYTHELDEPPTSTEQAMGVFGPTARIAVETLAAQGDITDEQIVRALSGDPLPGEPYRRNKDAHQREQVRLLLARQAAVRAVTQSGDAL
jgi:hypothetical protein